MSGRPAVWCAVSLVLVVEMSRAESPVLADRKGESALDRLDRALVPDRLPKEVVAVLPARGERPCLCAFAPDGCVLAVGDETGAVHLWRFTDRGPTVGPVLQTKVGSVGSLAFSPDGKTLAVSGPRRMLELWDCQPDPPGRRTVLDGVLKYPLEQLTFAPNGKVLAAASYCTVYLWQVDGQRLTSMPPLEHEGGVWALVFSPDSRGLATGSRWSPDALVWEVSTCRERARLPGHDEGVVGFHFAPGGGSLTTVGWDGSGRCWELGSGKARVTHKAGEWPLCPVFAADGKLASVWGEIKSDLFKERLLPTLEVRSAKGRFQWRLPENTGGLAWAPDTRHLALVHREGHVYILRFPR